MDGKQKNDGVSGVRQTRSVRFKLLSGLLVAAVALLSLEVVTRAFISEPENSRFQQINEIVVFLGTQKSDLMLDFDSERFWKLKPNVVINDANNSFWQGTVSNSLGFRSEEFELERRPESLRVVCFGDSSTFGIGSRMEHTWPSQLEALIENSMQFSDADFIEVINAGVPGYSSYQGLQHMRQEIDRLQPDVVLASYANNDFWHWDQTTDAEHASRLSAANGTRRLLMNSRVVQLVADFSDHWQATSKLTDDAVPSPNQHWAEAATSNYVSPLHEWIRRVPLDSFRNNVNDMADLCEARKLPLIFVKWPDQPQTLGRWSPRIEYQEVLEDVASERGLGIADVVAVFQENRSWASRTYIPNDIVHVNRDGNRLAASAAFESLCDVRELNPGPVRTTN